MKQTLNAPSVTTATLEKIAAALDVPVWQLFVSPGEVKASSETVACPRCGYRIEVELKVK